MFRSSTRPIHRLGLLLAGLATLGCEPELADAVTPGESWPDLATTPVGVRDGRDDAALIIAIADPRLGGRPGAFELSSGWWRYLVGTRGLRKFRVTLLRDEQATAAAITSAIGRLEERADTGSLLWLVFIGSAIAPEAGGDGTLLTADGLGLPFADIREALSAGLHESAFMLVDACAELPPDNYHAGLPAVPSPGSTPRFRAATRPRPRSYYVGGSSPADSNGLAGIAAGVHARVEQDLRRQFNTPRNAFVITAGLGSRCGSELDGQRWPALAYAGLGALQGWADVDEDGHVSATELTIYAQAMIAGLDAAPLDSDSATPTLEPRPRVEAGGVNIILADITGFGGRRRSARHQPQAVEPAAASQTNQALAEAESMLELDVEDMVPVPPGSFRLGCNNERDPNCEPDERPARTVELGGYAIDRLEVSWLDYRACVRSGACDPLVLSACWVWTGEGFVKGAEIPAGLFADDHPAMCVNWVEAKRYCEAVGKRLPSEAEWERAARGVDGRVYPWGDEPPSCDRAVMHGCTDFSAPVGRASAGMSPVGALDMAGNVAEWVADWWSEDGYPRRGRVNPTGPDTGQVRGVRGGSFYDGGGELRSGYRYGVEALARLSTTGFRCVR